MRLKLWKMTLYIVLAVSLAMVAAGVVTYRTMQDKPLVCIAASVYDDGTIIERPCPAEVGAVDGLRMTLPTPGRFYRPLAIPDPE